MNTGTWNIRLIRGKMARNARMLLFSNHRCTFAHLLFSVHEERLRKKSLEFLWSFSLCALHETLCNNNELQVLGLTYSKLNLHCLDDTLYLETSVRCIF